MKIYDAAGRVIRQEKMNATDAEIEVNNYSGIVLVKIETQTGTVIKKLMMRK